MTKSSGKSAGKHRKSSTRYKKIRASDPFAPPWIKQQAAAREALKIKSHGPRPPSKSFESDEHLSRKARYILKLQKQVEDEENMPAGEQGKTEIKEQEPTTRKRKREDSTPPSEKQKSKQKPSNYVTQKKSDSPRQTPPPTKRRKLEPTSPSQAKPIQQKKSESKPALETEGTLRT